MGRRPNSYGTIKAGMVLAAVLLITAAAGCVTAPLPMPRAPATGVAAATRPAARTPLSDVLKLNDDRERIRFLAGWRGEPTDDEVTVLKALVEEYRDGNWRVQHLAISHLRRHRPSEYPAPAPKVAEAERILSLCRWGKYNVDRYDHYAPKLAGLGKGVVPLLIDMLQRNDPWRRQLAMVTLVRMKDKRVIPAFKKAAGRLRGYALSHMLAALLTVDASDKNVDWVGGFIAARRHDQESLIGGLSHRPFTVKVKMRLYLHYERFSASGQWGVIRGLGRIGNRAAYDQLVGIVRDRKLFADSAASFLGESQFRKFGPGPVLMEYVAGSGTRSKEKAVIALGEVRYRPAVAPLREFVEADPSARRGGYLRVLAAGSLCALGDDYKTHAAIVRAALTDKVTVQSAYNVVKFLHDAETIKVLISQIGKRRFGEGSRPAVEALGRIGDVSALSALRGAALEKIPPRDWPKVAEAIEAIGRKNNRRQVVREAAELRSLSHVIVPWGGAASPPKGRGISENLDAGAAALKRNPKLIPIVLKHVGPTVHNLHSTVQLLDRGWHESATPVVERIVKTNKSVLRVRLTPKLLHYYIVRSHLAELLTRKTGRPHTFVDIDGTVRPGGWKPNP